MIKRLSIKILTITMILLWTNADLLAQTRVNFKRGQKSAVVAGMLAANNKRLYIVRGQAGQTLSVEVNSDKLAINLRRGKAETTEDIGDNVAGMTADLQENGDYVFELSNQSKQAIKFRMVVSIE